MFYIRTCENCIKSATGFALTTTTFSPKRQNNTIVDIVDALIKYGANINHQDNEGQTALFSGSYCL